jgi:Ca2+-binding RTX toxin-like protein
VSTSTTSANGLILTTEAKTHGAETKYKDVTTTFAGSNGSYQFVRFVDDVAIASVTHMIDAEGIDTWSWKVIDATTWAKTTGTPTATATGQITIDSETERRYLDAAGSIFRAALDRDIGGDEIEMLAQYITNGQLDRNKLATNILAGDEYFFKYGSGVTDAAMINDAYMNLFGQLPTAAVRTQLAGLTQAQAMVAIAELGRTSGQVIRSDEHDGTAFGTVSYADLAGPAGVTASLATVSTGTGDSFYGVNNLIGSAFNDTLTGSAGDNILIGGAGNDSINGGLGSDTAGYLGASSGVTVNLAVTTAQNTGGAGTDTLSNMENAIGSSFADTQTGGLGNSVLEGGAGADILDGGVGNDTGKDTASYAGSSEGVTVDLRITTAQSSKGDASGDVLSHFENLRGSGFSDTLLGDANVNTLEGLDGNDLLQGFGGADALKGGIGTDTVTYKDAAYGVTADMSRFGLNGLSKTGGVGQFGDAAGDTYEGIENLEGSKFNDVLVGTQDANVIDGGASDPTKDGNDTLIGGSGNDVYKFGLGGGRDEIVDNNDGTYDTSYKDVKRVLPGSYSYGYTWYGESGHGATIIHNETVTVSANLSVDDYNIVMTEKAHADAGNDTILLGSGIALADLAFEIRDNDLYIGIKSSSPAGTPASAMADAMRLVNWTDAMDRVENLKFADGKTVSIAAQVGAFSAVTYTEIAGGTGNDTLTGKAAVERITGGAGNDAITGGAGNDRLEGGAGNDLYSFNRGDGWDAVRDENLKVVTETVDSYEYDANKYSRTYSYSYNANGESGSGTRTVNYTDTGPRITTATHTVEQDAGDDTIAFGAGIAIDDLAMRIQGNDLIIAIRDNAHPDTDFWALKDQMRIENWVDAFDRLEILTFANGMTLDISQVLAITSGNKEDDVISGSDGADIFSGDGGNDIISGGDGNDILSGNTGNDVLTGGEGNDQLLGGDGNDTLAGGNGINTLTGGAGNDTYLVEALTDTIVELAAGGTDTVQTALNGYSLASMPEVENLTLIGTGDLSGTGNAGANTLTGNTGNNILDGGAGADTMVGGKGNDTYYVDSNSDVITELANQGFDTEIVTVSGITMSTTVEVLQIADSAGAGITATGSSAGSKMMANKWGSKLTGGAANDTLVSGAAGDTLNGGTGTADIASYENATAGVTATLGISATITGEAIGDTYTAIDGLTGSNLDDKLYGFTAAAAILDGGKGNDQLFGGTANDTFVVDAAGDVVSDTGGTGDTVQSWISNSLVNYTGIENLTLLGADNINATGNTGTNVITGNDGDNILDGGADTIADTLKGGLGNDTYVLRSTLDAITETDGIDTIQAEVSGITMAAGTEILILTANAGAGATATGNATGVKMVSNNLGSKLTGGAANDILVSGSGADTLTGGAGTADIASYENASGNVSVTLDLANWGSNSGTTDTYVTIEGLQGGNGNDELWGFKAAASILDGGKGNDKLHGGTLNDTFVIGQAGDTIDDLGGTDTVQSAEISVDLSLFTGLENATLLGAANINATGNSGVNTITGNDGDNILDGGIEGAPANDTLKGGLGDDTYILRNVGDIVTEVAGEGTDTIVVTTSGITMAANVEILKVDDTAAAGTTATGNNAGITMIAGKLGSSLTGGTGNDTLQGGDGNDTLNGGTDGIDTISGGKGDDILIGDSDADVLDGGDGIDTADYTNSYNWVDINLKTGVIGGGSSTDSIGDVLKSIENLTGSAYADTLTGDDGDNVLSGGNGVDILDGGLGHDILKGGLGNELYIINDDDEVVELGGEGTDTVETTLAYYKMTANVEKLVFDGNVAATGIGNDLANTITGNDGNNTLDGGDGAGTAFAAANDILVGGLGDDTFILRNLGDVITEAANEGEDTIVVNFSGYTMAANTDILKVSDDAGANALATGAAGDVKMYANTLGSKLTGGSGNDTLVSGKGADTFAGGGSSILDVVSYETASKGVVADLTTASNNTNEAYGDTYSAIEGLTGSAFNDTLNGFTGNETFDGGQGIDTMAGAAGNDTYIVDTQADVIVELAAAGTDTVKTALDSYTLTAANVENLTATGTKGQALTGNNATNTITGSAGDDTLDGGNDAVADTLVGGLGNDTYLIRSSLDVVTEAASAGTDTAIISTSGITWTAGANIEVAKIADGVTNVTLVANTTGMTLIGNGLDNIIVADGGADTINGASGNDTASYQNSTAIVNVNLGAGTASGGDAAGDKLTSIENVTGGAYADILTGDDNVNVLTGLAGADTLDGGKGDDILVGNAGNDIYIVDSENDQAIETLAADGTDTVQSSAASYKLGAFVENLVITKATGATGTGNDLANILTGGAGDDTLDGGTDAANDTMIGGDGNDTFIVRNTGDIVQDGTGSTFNGGTSDTILSYVNYGIGNTWSNQIENLVLLGSATTATGNWMDNTLTGNDLNNTLSDSLGGNDTFIGGKGADSMTGGAGNDFASYETAAQQSGGGYDGVTASLQNTTLNTFDAQGDTYTTIEGLKGSNFNDKLYGFTSLASILDGGKGDDLLTGGTLNDTYVVDSSGDIVSDAGGTADIIQSWISNSLVNYTGIENLVLNGTDNINGTGNSSVNKITGNTGDNILDGGADTLVDILVGLDGDDTYILRNADTVTETSTGGKDTIEIAFAGTAYTVADYVETVKIQAGVAAGTITANGRGMTLIGNELANTLVGGALNDVLIGGAMGDAMTGGVGTQDIASYETATSKVTASLASSASNTGDAQGDTYLTIEGLRGSNFNDTLTGLAAVASILDGGKGDDVLIGGTAADTYYVDSANDVIVESGASGVDVVYSTAASYTLSANLETLNLVGTALNGTGNSLNNTINGNAGDNILDGGAGNDALLGGLGNDTYILDAATDVVTEGASAGNDTIEIRFNTTALTVAANVETVKVAAGYTPGAITANATGVTFLGNALNNTFIGAAGNDVFDGGAGADAFTGNGGTDTVTYANATGYVIADMTTTVGSYGDAAGDTFATIETLIGSDFNDVMTGGTGNDTLFGGKGTDTLTGGAGNDILVGGLGNDLLSGGLGADIYQIARGEGTDTIVNAHTDALVDTLQFGAAIDESQLWFTRNGNDLEIDIIGSTDGAKISGWYANAQNQLSIKDASGHTLIAANVEALVAAMAAFSAPPIGQTTLDTALQAHLQPVIAASWS